MNASTGTGNYQAGELVYEGRTLSAANATGFVDSWSNTTKTLIVSDVNGILREDRYLTGAVTNTAYKIQTFNTADSQLSKLVIVPNPITANAQTAFGFDETILEFPNIS